MKKIVYLHIGTPKTATTFLQKAFVLNNKELMRQGIIYPLAGRYTGSDKHLHLHHNISALGFWFASYRPKQESRLRKNGSVGESVLGKIRNDLLKEIDNFPGDKVLISCENFWKLDLKQIKILTRIFTKFHVKIIAYLRRQDLFLESRSTNLSLIGDIEKYRQLVLNPRSHYRRACNYSSILDKWSSIVGFDNMIVRIFENNQLINGNILDDFMSIIGGKSKELPEEPKKENQSLFRDGLEIKTVLNGLLLDPNKPNPLSGAKVYIQYINEYIKEKALPKYSIFTEDERRKLIEEYRTINNDIAKRYIGRDNGFLFDTSQSGTDFFPNDQYPGLSPEIFSGFLDYLRKKDEGLYMQIVYIIQAIGKERICEKNHRSGRLKRSNQAFRILRKILIRQ